MNTAERRWELQQNAERLVQELLRRGWKTAAAESCTGGMVTQALTSVPGASGVLDYGVITYSNAVKQRELGVSGESLEARLRFRWQRARRGKRRQKWAFPLRVLPGQEGAPLKSRWERCIFVSGCWARRGIGSWTFWMSAGMTVKLSGKQRCSGCWSWRFRCWPEKKRLLQARPGFPAA